MLFAASPFAERREGDTRQCTTIPASTRPRLTHEIVGNITSVLVSRFSVSSWQFQVGTRISLLTAHFLPGCLYDGVQAFQGVQQQHHAQQDAGEDHNDFQPGAEQKGEGEHLVITAIQFPKLGHGHRLFLGRLDRGVYLDLAEDERGILVVAIGAAPV